MSESNPLPQAQAQAPPPATNGELELVKPENRNDPRYFYLSKPINADGRELHYLLLDPEVKELGGRELMKLIATYHRRFPDEARSNIHPIQKYTSENFLSLVLAKLNGITPEDVYQVPYKQLTALFSRAGAFQFSAEGNVEEQPES